MSYLEPLRELNPRPGLERADDLFRLIREGPHGFRVREIGWKDGRRRVALERSTIIEIEPFDAWDQNASQELMNELVDLMLLGDPEGDFNDGANLWTEAIRLLRDG